jgi:hypothetical protein
MQKQVLQSQRQPSSFFDYYDEGILEDSDHESFYGEDDDDSFDETTLWEIANLLRSDQVPSRESLFLGDAEDGPRSFAAQGPTLSIVPSSVSLEQQVSEEEDSESIQSAESTPPLLRRQSSSPTLPPTETPLWVSTAYMPSTTETAAQGLFQDDKLWDTYVKEQFTIVRATRRQAKRASKITSTSLWIPSTTKSTQSTAHLWSVDLKSQLSVKEPVVQVEEISPPETPEAETLWSAPTSTAATNKAVGLPQPASDAWGRYTDLETTKTSSRSLEKESLSIESTSLWNQRASQQEKRTQWLEPEPPLSSDHDGEKSLPLGVAKAASIRSAPVTAEALVKNVETGEAYISIDEQSIFDAGELQDGIIATTSPLDNDLWIPISMLPVDSEQHGLFNMPMQKQQDKSFRRSSKLPAALETRPTSRSVRESLPAIKSQNLWTPPSRQTCSQDWVTLSSVRPSTPPPCQPPSEYGSESPLSDTASAFSNLSGESTVSSFLTGQTSVQLEPQFVTDADWTATIHSAGTATRPRDEIVGSVPHWAAALHVGPEQEGQPTTARDKSEELQPSPEFDAEVAPRPFSIRRQTQIGGFDPARHHPVFNVYMLDTSHGDCHPAAQGYNYTLVNGNPDLIRQ